MLLRVLALALVPMFVNALLLHCLIAAGRPQRVPVLTGVRVAVAGLLALALVPTWGAAGAAWGFLAAEGALLVAAAGACAAVGFAVPLASPLAWGAALALPCTAAAALGGAGLVVPGTAAAIVYALLAMGVMAHARGLERKEAMGIR